MSRYAAFRRQPVEPQAAAQLRETTLPAPTRGIIQDENEAYMRPGGAIIQDNWAPTLRGCKLRGGFIRHCVLPEAVFISSGFEYSDGVSHKMFAANNVNLYDVTTSTPALVNTWGGNNSGNWAAAQYTTADNVNWLLAVNDYGDPPLRFNGSIWTRLDPPATPPATAPDGASWITGPVGSAVEQGDNLVYVWKYRSRLFFIEKNSFNAWYLDIDAIGGVLQQIPLSGAAAKGGRLLFGATWSTQDVGDAGADDRCVFVTTEGEALIFAGTNPGDAASWRQEGRYAIGRPIDMNAHLQLGGDLLICTVDGIVPLSVAIQKDSGQLELSMLTRSIKNLWRAEVAAKPPGTYWTLKKWDEYGAFFVATPISSVSILGLQGPGPHHCLLANDATGAWARFTWDATCFLQSGSDFFFGTPNGIIMQAEKGGQDDGALYTATLVGGWETFGAPANQVTWMQSRCIFRSRWNQPFAPQLSATIDYRLNIPNPPDAGPDPGPGEVWDQGTWDATHWDVPVIFVDPIRNTLWVSIGQTGFAHAPIIQVTVHQAALPEVELLATSVTYLPAGVNV
jgi:hypothetical protein